MSNLSHALALVRQGFHVFPCYAVLEAGTAQARCACKLGAECGSPGKHPIGNTARAEAGAGGVKVATRDVAVLRDWWGRWPTCNVGIRTGLDDRVVLDVDGAEGYATLAQLEGELGALPATLVARSGRAGGGEHRWLRSAALAALGSRKLAPGLDLKAKDGYVVGPGSVHKTGKRYAWAARARVAALPATWEAWAQRAIEERKPQPAPWDRPAYVATAATPEGKVEAILARLAAAPEGDRNEALNKAAYTLGGMHAGGQCDDVRQRLEEIALGIGLEQRETTASIRSGWTKGMARPLYPRHATETVAAQQQIAAMLRADVRANDHRARAAQLAPAPRPLPPKDPEPVDPYAKLPDDLKLAFSRCGQEIAGLVPGEELARWSDAREGFRVRLMKALADVLLSNEVGLVATQYLLSRVDFWVEEENPTACEGLDPAAVWAKSTIKRQMRGQTNYGATALAQLMGEDGAALLVRLQEACADWARQAPLAPDLSPFEGERLKHVRSKAKLLDCLRAIDAKEIAVDEGTRRSFAAAIHCSEYSQEHVASCCGTRYARQTRVCELFFCVHCGPRVRAETLGLAAKEWTEHHKIRVEKVIHKRRIAGAPEFHMETHGGLDVTVLRGPPFGNARAAAAAREEILRGFCKRTQDHPYRWFEGPECLIFVVPSGAGSTIAKYPWQFDAVYEREKHDRIEPAAAIALIQKVWNERAFLVRDEIEKATKGLRDGDTKLAQAQLLRLAQAGWLRDLRWQGGNAEANKTLPWPCREGVRKRLKDRARAEREAAGQPSAAAPKTCPAHKGEVLIDLVHQRTRRVIASRLRHPVCLLDAVRLDPERLVQVSPRTKRPPKLTPEEAAYWAEQSKLMRARAMARRDLE